MENFAIIPIGNDARYLSGYVFSTSDRLGPINLVFENLGASAGNTLLGDNVASQVATNDATIIVKYFTLTGYSSTTGAALGTWTNLIAPFNVKAGGRVSQSAVVFAKYVGIFGSGSTRVSLEIPHPHAAALRGGEIGVISGGRMGWGFSPGLDREISFPTPPSV